jgi:hypothetical protein
MTTHKRLDRISRRSDYGLVRDPVQMNELRATMRVIASSAFRQLTRPDRAKMWRGLTSSPYGKKCDLIDLTKL